MASDFLQGLQVGANMFAQAKQLQEARQRSLQQAQEMMLNMRAAKQLEAYRQQQMALQRQQMALQQAQEERLGKRFAQEQEVYKQGQQFGPFVQRRFEELQAQTPRGTEPGATEEELAPLMNRAVREGVMKYMPEKSIDMYMKELDFENKRLAQENMNLRLERSLKVRESEGEANRALQTQKTEASIESRELSQKKTIALAKYKMAQSKYNALAESFVEGEELDKAAKELEDAKIELDALMQGVNAPAGAPASAAPAQPEKPKGRFTLKGVR